MKTGVSNNISVRNTQHAKRVTCKDVYYFNTGTAAEPQLMHKACTCAYNRQTTTTSAPEGHDISNFRGKLNQGAQCLHSLVHSDCISSRVFSHEVLHISRSWRRIKPAGSQHSVDEKIPVSFGPAFSTKLLLIHVNFCRSLKNLCECAQQNTGRYSLIIKIYVDR